MTIFTIATNHKSHDGSIRYFYVESQHIGVPELVADLRSGPVLCKKLHARFDRDNQRMLVSERKDFAIGAAIVGSIEQQNIPFVDVVAVAA
jgi:hypothetical protein